MRLVNSIVLCKCNKLLLIFYPRSINATGQLIRTILPKLLPLKLSPEIQEDKRDSSRLQFRMDVNVMIKFFLHLDLFFFFFNYR